MINPKSKQLTNYARFANSLLSRVLQGGRSDISQEAALVEMFRVFVYEGAYI